MLCRKCKAELPEGAVYCPMCGVKQERSKYSRSRPNGTGTVYKRGKTWTAKFIYGWRTDDATKKAYPLCRTKGGFATKREALEYLPILKAGPTPQGTRTLESYWQSFDSELQQKSRNKIYEYEKAYARLKPLASRLIGSISVTEIQRIIDRETPTYYPAKAIMTVVSKLWHLAEADDEVKKNLAPFLTLPKLEEKEPDHFDEKQIEILWKAFGDGRLYAGYILVMCYTGMMPGELRQLTPEMIDRDKRQIVGAGIKTQIRKNHSILLPDRILLVLDVLIDRTDGKLLTETSEDKFYKLYYDILAEYSLPRYTPYACRHSAGTALALAGATAPIIMRIMRHAKITTSQRYIHLGEADQITLDTVERLYSTVNPQTTQDTHTA